MTVQMSCRQSTHCYKVAGPGFWAYENLPRKCSAVACLQVVHTDMLLS